MIRNHVLVVDDEPEIANSLGDLLSKQLGYEVSRAYDGQEALTILKERSNSAREPIDLVVLDRRMPGLSGLEVLQQLRADPDMKYTRIVMLTGASGSQERVEALSAGADDYITKPYYPQELLARVETILRTQRLEKQLQRQGQQLAALNRATNAITTTLDIARIPEAAAESVRQVVDSDVGAVFLHEQATGLLHCQAVADGGGNLVAADLDSIPVDEGVLGEAYRSQRTLTIPGDELNTGSTPRSGADDNGRAPSLPGAPDLTVDNMLITPLIIRGRSVGLLCAVNKPEGAFTEADAELFTSLAGAVSRALENASLFQNVKARQQELQESHNRLQAVINGILHPIYTIDRQWRLVAVNRHKAEATGHRPDAIVGAVCYEAFFDRTTPCDHCQVAETLQQRAPRRWSVRWIGADHLPQEWDIHAYPLPGRQPEMPGAVLFWQDRTDERRLENSLLQAGKLAAIGQLAAGVAHEINNPLTAINANAQMLKMIIPPEEDEHEAVELIVRAGERAAKVVRGLLDFARQNQYNFEAGDLNQSILQALHLLSYQLRSADIRIARRFSEDVPEVTASWEHLKTVWLNLLINARDAVLVRRSERRIEIATRLASDGGHVEVLVTDNGQGIDPAEAAHIFEPFYTTKDPGQGTGLGLATSQRIVQQHGGSIEVVSEPGAGATFIVRLPLVARPGQVGERPALSTSPLTEGS